MSKRSVSYVAVAASLLALGLLALGQGGRSAVALTNCDTATADMNAAETQMLGLFNGARAAAGLSALKSSPNLNRAAAWKSADPSATGSGGFPFSHTDSLGRAPNTRVQQCGYGGSAAENIAYGFGGAQGTFDAWMNSAGHRANILGPYKVVGLGQVGSAWTADFGNFDDSGSSGTPASPIPTSQPTQPLPTSPPTSVPTSIPTTAPPALPPLGISVPLSAGENLVTYTGAEQPVMAALRSVADRLVVVYEWQVGEQRWAKFSPGKPGYVNTFTTMKPGGVYSIQLLSAGTWAY
jgi:uncharacterized protein YkwD